MKKALSMEILGRQAAAMRLNSGNLATTQQVVSRIKQHAVKTGVALTSMGSLFAVAELLGKELRDVITTTQSAVVLENLISKFLYDKAASGKDPEGSKP